MFEGPRSFVHWLTHDNAVSPEGSGMQHANEASARTVPSLKKAQRSLPKKEKEKEAKKKETHE